MTKLIHAEKFRERCRELAAGYSGATIRKTFGMELSFDDNGNAIVDLPFNPSLSHGLGDVHGGVISTMLDTAGWFAAAPHFDAWIATTDLHIQLLEPANKEHLRAIGQAVRVGKTIASSQVEVCSESGRVVAKALCTFMSTSVPYGKKGRAKMK